MDIENTQFYLKRPDLSFPRECVKWTRARCLDLYHAVFATRIGVRNVKSMRPVHRYLSVNEVITLLVEQTLRDDIPHSRQRMLERIRQNPFAKGVTLCYNVHSRRIYFYRLGSCQRRSLPASQADQNLQNSKSFRRYAARVAKHYNRQAA